MSRARDSQRAKYWKAIAVMDALARPLTPGETKRLTFSIQQRAFLTRRYPTVTRSFSASFGGGQLKGKRWSVSIPKVHHDDWAVVRVVTRMIWYRVDMAERLAWFGPEFCAIMLDVTQALMGKTASDTLRESFRAHRMRWKPKQKREVTPEMIERLARAREKMQS